MNKYFLSFNDLSPVQLMDLYALRQRVFIIEQVCFYEDIDGEDPNSEHLLLYDEKILAAYLRFFQPGTKFPESCLGRIVVDPIYRGGHVGKELITTAIQHSKKHFPNSPIRIEAQSELIRYYNTYGFKEEGKIYIVDDIPHIQMVLN